MVDLSARTKGGAVMLLRSPRSVAMDYVKVVKGHTFKPSSHHHVRTARKSLSELLWGRSVCHRVADLIENTTDGCSRGSPVNVS